MLNNPEFHRRALFCIRLFQQRSAARSDGLDLATSTGDGDDVSRLAADSTHPLDIISPLEQLAASSGPGGSQVRPVHVVRDREG